MKICWIESEPYQLTIPTVDDWNLLMDVTKEGDDTNWLGCYSWILSPEYKEKGGGDMAKVRGLLSPRHHDTIESEANHEQVGFRPCLIPLDHASLEPLQTFKEIPNGTIIRCGAAVMGNVPVRVGIKSKITYGSGEPLPDVIETFQKKQDICIADCPALFPEYELSWVVVGNKLVCTRNILRFISYCDLSELGIV